MTISNSLRTAASLGLVALSLAASACGGGGGEEDNSAGGTDPQSAQLRYAECMRDNGVAEFPDPDASGMVVIDPGASFSKDPDLSAAQEACADLLQDVTGGGGSTRGGLDDAQQDVFLALAECMREKGYALPDPSFDDGKVQVDIPRGGIDLDDPAFRAASDECASEVGMPKPGEGPAGAGGRTP